MRTNGAVKDRFSGFYAEKDHTLDIVMIGSSPVFPYYAAPKLWGETGIAMYLLSSNVQRPAAMKYLVEEAEKTLFREGVVGQLGQIGAAAHGLQLPRGLQGVGESDGINGNMAVREADDGLEDDAMELVSDAYEEISRLAKAPQSPSAINPLRSFERFTRASEHRIR